MGIDRCEPCDDEDWREVLCPSCDGDGGWAYGVDVSHIDGSLIERWEECRICGGDGRSWQQLEPITIEDLTDA